MTRLPIFRAALNGPVDEALDIEQVANKFAVAPQIFTGIEPATYSDLVPKNRKAIAPAKASSPYDSVTVDGKIFDVYRVGLGETIGTVFVQRRTIDRVRPAQSSKRPAGALLGRCREAEMLPGLRRQHPSARCAGNQALLQQVWLDHILDRIARLRQRGSEGFNTDRTAAVILRDAGQVAAIELIETSCHRLPAYRGHDPPAHG